MMTALLGAGSAVARGPHHRYCPRPHRVVVCAPANCRAAACKASSPFTANERLSLALAYLQSHKFLTVKQYSKITSLKKAAAEAELDAFSLNRRIPIVVAFEGKKKVYVKARGY